MSTKLTRDGVVAGILVRQDTTMWMAADKLNHAEPATRVDWATIGRLVRERAAELVRRHVEAVGGVRIEPNAAAASEAGDE